ncbi:MAG: conjugal transfer protein TraF [Phycisphaerales bacterium]|nr:conjugal transfer protein TraF [Phycisphaerales bacterium]
MIDPRHDHDRNEAADEPRAARAGGVAWFTVFLVVAALALAVIAMLLARSNRALRGQVLAAERALAMERTRDSLAVGESVGSLTLIDSAGAERALAFPAERAILMLLTSGHCPYCEQTAPVWERIVRQTEGGVPAGIEVLCVQIDARTATDLKPLSNLPRSMLAKDHATTWLRRVPISPGAVMIDRNGVVRKAWFGVPSERDQAEMAAALLGG